MLVPLFASLVLALSDAQTTHAKPISPAPAAQTAGALEGRWTGTMSLGDNEHPINLWFDAGERSGRFQIIGLTTDRNPIENIVRRGDVVTFTLPSNPVHEFRGTLRGQRLAGTVRIGGSNNRFSLQRVGS
ncbi:hypothetical protein ACETK8_20535 (plasmid) [Brevundimonas staleyi]|uniref:TIGR03067 domain-containing protein n=1 Tax=Brevundimonas staleyi TaxID=74326 RepID=A0ABW0FPU9_9CAUL